MARAEDRLSLPEPPPVLAEPVGNVPGFTPDPARAYLLIESPRPLVFNFIAEPGEADHAAWDAQRAEWLARARTDWLEDVAQAERRRRVPPGEPTEDSVDWPDLAAARLVSVGPQSPFSSTGGTYAWLTALPPGRYTFYGSGRRGTDLCACMGTVGFELTAGQITSLGLATVRLDASGGVATGAAAGASALDIETRAAFAVRDAPLASPDPRLPAEMVVPARLVPVDRLANWFGGSVTRVMPVAGVFGYARDHQVDQRSSPLPATPPPVAEHVDVPPPAMEPDQL